MVGREQAQVLAVLLQRPALSLVRHRRHLNVNDARRRRLDRAIGAVFCRPTPGSLVEIALHYAQAMRQIQAASGEFFLRLRAEWKEHIW
jgi:hypothetical protein